MSPISTQLNCLMWIENKKILVSIYKLLFRYIGSIYLEQCFPNFYSYNLSKMGKMLADLKTSYSKLDEIWLFFYLISNMQNISMVWISILYIKKCILIWNVCTSIQNVHLFLNIFHGPPSYIHGSLRDCRSPFKKHWLKGLKAVIFFITHTIAI